MSFQDMITPFRLLELTQVFRRMRPGEIMEIIVHDPDTKKDLFRVLPASSYKLILMEEMGSPEIHRIHLQKTVAAS